MEDQKSEDGSISSSFSVASAASHRSKDHPPLFSTEPKPPERPSNRKRSHDGTSTSSLFSEASAESHRSKDHPPLFSTKLCPPKRPSMPRWRNRDGTSTSSSFSEASVASHRSKDHPPLFSTELCPPERPSNWRGSHEGLSSPSSISEASAASHRSKDHPPLFSTEPKPPERTRRRSPEKQEMLKAFESKAMTFMNQALRKHTKVLSAKHKELFDGDEGEEELQDCDDETSEAALKIALHVLRTMNEGEHVRTLEQRHYGELRLYQQELKSFWRMKHSCLFEAINSQQLPVPLKQIYTELYLLEGDGGDVNLEHEVRQIEAAFSQQSLMGTLIQTEDLFKPCPRQGPPTRTVLTRGIAGIGKTVLVQKFLLDWSEDKAHQDFQLLFSLPFRELNLLRQRRCSFMELLQQFHPSLKTSGITDLEKYRVLLVLDGLDECRFPLNFNGGERITDACHPAAVEVLLTNLISGKLLPGFCLWVTTRPAAANGLPPACVHRLTEIRGFNNRQKEQYFLKKIQDENLAKQIIANIKSTRSLYIMCHVPMFCWISSIVLVKMCEEEPRSKKPKTLTQMYIHFLTQQTAQMYVKYQNRPQLDSQGNNKAIMALGKLAFQQLQKGNLIFYEDDLRDCGIPVQEASVYSGLCTQVFREESCLQTRVFCFVHLSIQEFLAALYVHVTYKLDGVNLMTGTDRAARAGSVSELHKAAVDQALRSDNGHLDLFLRFLLGLSLQSSRDLLRVLDVHVEASDSSQEETARYIKERIDENLPPEKYINLFHCLNELNDQDLMEEIQGLVEQDGESVMDRCSAARWAALVFLLVTSPERRDHIDLKKYSGTEEGLARLLPAIRVSKTAALKDCNLREESCRLISSALSSRHNKLQVLNLSDNSLWDTGLELLSAGLKSSCCRLKTLRLNRCCLTWRSCQYLATVLRTHLQELDLSHNNIQDSGVQLLCSGLEKQRCKLETLRLSFCEVTGLGCSSLALAVMSNPTRLKELDLSYNHLGEEGPRLLSRVLEEAGCQFTRLRVDHNAEHWLRYGLRKHARDLTLDPNSAHELLVLSDDQRSVHQGRERQPYPDHPDRFDYWPQVLFRQGLTGRCYWELEWGGDWAGVGAAYASIGRKGPDNDSVMGYNRESWSLHCSGHGYRAYHDLRSTVVPVPPARSRRLAVFLDWDAGVLSFYSVSAERFLTHLHTFMTRFSSPLFPVFRVWGKGSSLRICQVEQ
ncbi:NLR family CARD domain-containing protein 3-like isoform X2 [Cololabis saira]|uniref:NLR family CARD domain-containing protein 3-like isoform X2 n=1 Tax=Cololabis saira TaxID=129043 RepID=UPI002AD24B55|nr:NLR family CARD domain-containing protein 3-like isoform X2 [Cololabis saira]